MARTGRPPKPQALKRLEGNPGKRKLNENEPECSTLPPTEPPEWLDAVAKKEYRRARDLLVNMGLINACDKAAFEAYCDAYSTMVKCGEIINRDGFVCEITTKTGNPYIQQLPYVNIKNQAMAMIRQFAQEFGMTPSSRGRLQVKPNDEEEVDDMEAILAGKAVAPDLKVMTGGKK